MNHGLESRLTQRLDNLEARGSFANIHGVVIAARDQFFVERYFTGNDERWGQPLGDVRFDADTLHDLRSVSKSVVALLYGIALANGDVPVLDQSLLECFPQYDGLDSEHLRRRITIADALTMQLGLQWDEELPYSDPRNSEIAMEQAADRCRYVLEREIVDEPGTRWRYNGGATALLAALIVRGSGKSLLDYANEKLFAPLAIGAVDWITGQDGAEVAASGLRMRPRDLATLGMVVLNNGRHDSRQLVPEAWIKACLQPHARIDDVFDYGYQWWIPRQWNWVAAFGNGGQRLTVLPRANLVVVVTAGNYNAQDAWKVPVGVLTDIVLPALQA